MKQTVKTILVIFAIILPFLFVSAVTVFFIPCQYSNTFLAELSDKYERLKSIKEPKTIVIGGSNLAFGLDSASLEKYTGKPVVNFGLYASLGTKAMLDLSRSSIKKGDIVIICPEPDAQTLSMYYNGETMWQALDCNYGMLKDAGFGNYGALLGSFLPFSFEKYSFYKNTPDPRGVYNKSSFNEYGDIKYERPFNNMLLGYDPSHMINLDPSIVNDEFADYLNQYANDVRRKGAKIYFSFAPMNKLALKEGTTDQSIYEFYQYLGRKLNFEIISNINDYILDSNYFFDTNFHLNDVGVKVRTSLLATDLLRAMGEKSSFQLDLSPAPLRPNDYFQTVREDDNSGFFLYEDVEGGVTLSGISEIGLSQKELIMPTSYQGKPVLSISAGAFSKCTRLKTVIIAKNTNIKQIYDEAFSGCESLERIEIQVLPNTFLVGLDILKGTNPNCKVYVSRDLYGEFATDYIWSQLMSRVSIDNG